MFLLRLILFPGLAIVTTLFWIWLDYRMGWRGSQAVWPGVFLILLGVGMCAWVAVLFLARGGGSPHPLVAKTKRLVVAGPFKIVRNPMMWGIAAVLVGLCLLLGSASLWAGVGCFVVFVALFVPLYEERDMERRFGEEYREYCRQVPRWFPRVRAREVAKHASVGQR